MQLGLYQARELTVVCDLLNDAVSIWDCIVVNDKMINE
jgi:hypothetical protein